MSFSTNRYLLMTVDPVHIGTGGTRLGRVDNSIVRESGTRLPKIPGTSLSGAIRSYAAYRYGKRQCAGQGGHCGQPTCPICYTFGSISDDRSYSGIVSIGDARMLLFPVYSMTGPVWVTSPSTLEDFGIKGQTVDDEKAKWNNGITDQKHLNLGWLMVEKDETDKDEIWQVPEDLKDRLPELACDRIVLVSDKLFSQVVNSNLEVRTSVAINPETGAAEDKALFTYEAIPRSAFLWMDVVVDDFRVAFPSLDRLEKWLKENGNDFAAVETPNRNDLKNAGYKDAEAKETLEKYKAASLIWNDSASVVTAGLEWAEHLGIGGMGTRGFGRVRKVNCSKLHSNAQSTEEDANVS